MSEDQEIKIGLTCSDDDANNSEIPNPSWAVYGIGDEVEKIKGSNWKGKVVGFYSTTLTPKGYAIESSSEQGSVQIYPESAIKRSETESERNERERMEASYDLYCEWYQTIWLDIIGMSSIEDFIHDERVCKSWLAIVDKTNYRLIK